MAIDYSGLISEAGRAALSSVGNLPPEQRRAKMNDMLANGLLPFSVALAVDKQLTSPMKENAPSPRPGSVMSDKMSLLQKANTGIDQLPVPTVDQAQFAGGGIIAFDDGGTTTRPDIFSGMKAADPKNKRYGWLQVLKGMYGEEPRSREDIQREVDAEREKAGIGKAASKYQGILEGRQKELDTAPEEDRKAARKAGWLALAQAGLEGKGLIEGGIRGLAKNAEVMEAKNKERKAELRELQKEQYSLELAMEQAKAAGNKEAYDRYAAERERNFQMQRMVMSGVQSMYEMESAEDRAAADRAMQGRKEAINERYGTAIWQLQQRLDNPATTPGEAERLTAQIKTLRERWRADNEAVGAASVYGANTRLQTSQAAALERLFKDDFTRASAEAQTALATYNQTKNPEHLKRYMEAQARVNAMIDQIKRVASTEGGSAEGAPTKPAVWQE